MPKNVFPLDSAKPFTEQQILGHNRWHPDIPPAVSVKPGDSFRVDCREWFDGYIKNDDSAEDIATAPLHTVHTLSGPFRIEGAKPGDLLVVDILNVGPIPQEDDGPLSGQLSRLAPRLPAGVPARDRVPDHLRLVGGAGVPAAGRRTDRGTVLGGRRYPECLRDRVPAAGHLRDRHPPRGGGDPEDRPRHRRTARERRLSPLSGPAIRREEGAGMPRSLHPPLRGQLLCGRLPGCASPSSCC